jgi:serine/threonine protein kinase
VKTNIAALQDYKFEPKEYWANVTDTARDFIKECLTIDPVNRPTAAECLNHKVRTLVMLYVLPPSF